MSGSPLYPAGQVQTGLSVPDLSNPAWHCAPGPQGLGVHRSFFSNGLQLTNGSPVYPLGQEQTALWLVASQVAPLPQTLGLGS